jgi:hypothetical protein
MLDGVTGEGLFRWRALVPSGASAAGGRVKLIRGESGRPTSRDG